MHPTAEGAMSGFYRSLDAAYSVLTAVRTPPSYWIYELQYGEATGSERVLCMRMPDAVAWCPPPPLPVSPPHWHTQSQCCGKLQKACHLHALGRILVLVVGRFSRRNAPSPQPARRAPLARWGSSSSARWLGSMCASLSPNCHVVFALISAGCGRSRSTGPSVIS